MEYTFSEDLFEYLIWKKGVKTNCAQKSSGALCNYVCVFCILQI